MLQQREGGLKNDGHIQKGWRDGLFYCIDLVWGYVDGLLLQKQSSKTMYNKIERTSNISLGGYM